MTFHRYCYPVILTLAISGSVAAGCDRMERGETTGVDLAPVEMLVAPPPPPPPPVPCNQTWVQGGDNGQTQPIAETNAIRVLNAECNKAQPGCVVDKNDIGCTPPNRNGRFWQCHGGKPHPMFAGLAARCMNGPQGGGGAVACGDGFCDDPDESCASCSSDCGECAVCGDSFCDFVQGEDCVECAADCQASTSTSSPSGCPICGDLLCEDDESCELCAADCCAP
jgi:hypothetical protein